MIHVHVSSCTAVCCRQQLIVNGQVTTLSPATVANNNVAPMHDRLYSQASVNVYMRIINEVCMRSNVYEV